MLSSSPIEKIDQSLLKEAIQKGHSGNISKDTKLTVRKISFQEFQDKSDLTPEENDFFGNAKSLTFSRIEGYNFPPHSRFSVYRVRMDKSISFVDYYTASENGQLNLPLVHQGFMQGEGVSFIFVSEDGGSYIAETLFPNPIETSWEDGAYLVIQMMDFDTFCLKGKNFDPGEQLKFTSISCGERLSYSVHVNKSGISDTQLLLPAVTGQKGGKAVLKIERVATKQSRELTYFWGTEAKKTTNRTNQ